jgi:predicted SAM-dependent methyltransferase
MYSDRNDVGVGITGPKLNLGCGFDYRDGYINVDMNEEHHPDLQSDVTWLRSIEDESCAEALAQDVLEHIPRAKGTTALREWNRVLKYGGRLIVRVPSLIHLFQLLADHARQDLATQQRLIQCLYGTQGYDGDFHFNGFTEVTLRHALADAGFSVQSIKIVDEWMFEAEAQKVAHVTPDPILRAPIDEAFLDRAYQTLLRRPADPQGKAYYLKVMGGGIAREAVIEALKASDEFKATLSPKDPGLPVVW